MDEWPIDRSIDIRVSCKVGVSVDRRPASLFCNHFLILRETHLAKISVPGSR
jgi:hypothetical protein